MAYKIGCSAADVATTVMCAFAPDSVAATMLPKSDICTALATVGVLMPRRFGCSAEGIATTVMRCRILHHVVGLVCTGAGAVPLSLAGYLRILDAVLDAEWPCDFAGSKIWVR